MNGHQIRRVVVTLAGIAVLVAGLWCVAWYLGSRNPHTPAGYVGYVYRDAWFGKAQFLQLQKGPTSAGRGWLYRVLNVSITPYTYPEEFTGESSVLAKDDLKISFRAHIVWRVKEEGVQEFVEQYSTLEASGQRAEDIVQMAYSHYMKEPLRTYCRDEVQRLKGFQIKDQIESIGRRILERAQKRAEGTPYEILDAVVGNIQYPDTVSEAVAQRLKAVQDLERMGTEVQIEEKKKEKRIVEAEGIAKAMDIISQKLTPPYLQYLAVEAQKLMVGSPNHTTIYIPTGAMGLPLVGTLDMSPPKKNADQTKKTEKSK